MTTETVWPEYESVAATGIFTLGQRFTRLQNPYHQRGIEMTFLILDELYTNGVSKLNHNISHDKSNVSHPTSPLPYLVHNAFVPISVPHKPLITGKENERRSGDNIRYAYARVRALIRVCAHVRSTRVHSFVRVFKRAKRMALT